MGAATLRNFCNQFGDDVYARILLEVLFEGLINAEALFIFGEQEQTRHQIGDGASEPGISQQSGERSERIETPRDLGATDRPDYP